MAKKSFIEEIQKLMQNLYINDNFAKLLTSENQILLNDFVKTDSRIQVKYTLKQLELIIFTDHIIESVLSNLNPNGSSNIESPSLTTSSLSNTNDENIMILKQFFEVRKILLTNSFEFRNNFYGINLIDYNYYSLIVKIINDFDNVYNPEKTNWYTYNKHEIENIYLPCGEIEFSQLVNIYKVLKLESIKTSFEHLYFIKQDIINYIIKDFKLCYTTIELIGTTENVKEYFTEYIYEEIKELEATSKHNIMFIIIEIEKNEKHVINYIESVINSYIKTSNFKIIIKQTNRLKNNIITLHTIAFKKR